jgi:hypothetical protein
MFTEMLIKMWWLLTPILLSLIIYGIYETKSERKKSND